MRKPLVLGLVLTLAMLTIPPLAAAASAASTASAPEALRSHAAQIASEPAELSREETKKIVGEAIARDINSAVVEVQHLNEDLERGLQRLLMVLVSIAATLLLLFASSIYVFFRALCGVSQGRWGMLVAAISVQGLIACLIGAVIAVFASFGASMVSGASLVGLALLAIFMGVLVVEALAWHKALRSAAQGLRPLER